MFAYIKSHANSEMVFDPSRVEFDKALFPKKDWGYSIYDQAASNSQEELPPDMPNQAVMVWTREYISTVTMQGTLSQADIGLVL